RDWSSDVCSSDLKHSDTEIDNACNVGRMTGDFTVALHRVHISEIHTAAFDFDGTDQNGAFPYSVDVHMTVRPVFKLLDGFLIVMRRIEKELNEVPRE